MSTAVDPQQLGAEAEAELPEARERRERLSLDALAGDEAASEELRKVEARIAELERQIVLASLASAEKTRRDRIAEEEAERERRKQARRDAEAASARREKALGKTRAALAALSEAVRGFLHYEAELQDASVRAGVRFVPLAEAFGELVVVNLRDAGIPGEAFSEWVPAAARKRLLDRFGELPPITETGEDKAANGVAAVARCSICARDDRDKIEQALGEGATMRDISERFGVSRSSLSRHTKHNGGTT